VFKMIAAYSPQARGRSERSLGIWQGRLPQELGSRGTGDVERADEFLRIEYTAEFNGRFAVTAAQKGTAFVCMRRKDLDWIFSMQHERTVDNDNTVALDNRAPLARHPRGSKRHLARAPGWPRLDPLRTARDRLLRSARVAATDAPEARNGPTTRDPSGGMTHREQAFPEMETPPPALRDLSSWAGISDRERAVYAPLNPGPGTSLANQTGHRDVVPTRGWSLGPGGRLFASPLER
jgi:hypothetical protein